MTNQEFFHFEMLWSPFDESEKRIQTMVNFFFISSKSSNVLADLLETYAQRHKSQTPAKHHYFNIWLITILVAWLRFNTMYNRFTLLNYTQVLTNSDLIKCSFYIFIWIDTFITIASARGGRVNTKYIWTYPFGIISYSIGTGMSN